MMLYICSNPLVGVGIDMILKWELSSISTDFVQNLEGKRLAVRLNKIDKVREALKHIDIKNVNFADDNAIIGFAVKERTTLIQTL